MNFESIIIGLGTFLLIGVFHPLVVKGEYYFSKSIWRVFLVAGISCLVLCLFIKNHIVSSLLSITGFTCLWSIKELFEQEERVKKGWAAKIRIESTKNRILQISHILF